MILTWRYKKIISLTTAFLSIVVISVPSLAAAANSSTPAQTALQQQHLANIKSKGDLEISRRLTQLKKLSSIISASVHLSASDQSSLLSEVNNEVIGLTSLETQLNSETVLANAVADAKNIFSEYRVYALVTPKVWLIKTADDQQSVETKLTTLASKLQTRLNAEQTAGKNVTTLSSTLSDMNTQITNAQSISISIEAAVLPLQPTDYDSNHTVLSGDSTKLHTANADIATAYSDAKSIISGLKNL